MENIVGRTLRKRYRVDAFIGRGGMAEVFKVWDQQRAVFLAMKLLREDLAIDRVFMRRFQREARTLERLQHPNIVRFYGLEQDGRLAFMLLDFIAGESLKHRIFDASGPLAMDQIGGILREVCGALQFAHSQGLVHCDIKPGNIMLDEHGQALLGDFGIARLTDAATATMVGAGTPAYMAPEQASGLDPIPQTDIYGLGIVLFEMLTGGERPFTGEKASITGSTSERVRWEQVHLAPISPRRFNDQIGPELEAVVLKCLEKDPAKRFTSALDLYNAFESAVTKGRNIPAEKPLPPPISGFDSEAPTMLESQPFAPALVPPQAGVTPHAQPVKTSKKWLWPVVIGISLLCLATVIGGIFLFYPPATPSVRTQVVAKLTDTRAPKPEAAVVDNPLKAEPEQDTEIPVAPTETRQPTDTERPATATARPPNTSKPATATERPTNTPLLEKPYLVADKTYFCRQSPDGSSEEHWMFTEGSENKLLGRSNNDWWLIAVNDPNTRTECCWVADGNPAGDLSIVPVISYEIDRMNCPPFP